MESNERDDLLANILPALSTQLRYALGNLHLAAASLVPAERREQDAQLDQQAAVLDQSFYQLLRLANNLTAAAYLSESDTLPLRDCDIVELVRDICLQSSSLAEHLGLQLSFSCRKESHVCAVHRDSMEQLLFQLLSNAFKFTPRGGSIAVEFTVSDGQVRLTVSDTGCGIDSQKMAALFSACSEEELRLPSHGVGLGLALCRRIAQGHGGTILVESRKGTRVTVAIPDRQSGTPMLRDIPFDYAGGFNHTLLGLADALPVSAFRVRQQD